MLSARRLRVQRAIALTREVDSHDCGEIPLAAIKRTAYATQHDPAPLTRKGKPTAVRAANVIDASNAVGFRISARFSPGLALIHSPHHYSGYSQQRKSCGYQSLGEVIVKGPPLDLTPEKNAKRNAVIHWMHTNSFCGGYDGSARSVPPRYPAEASGKGTGRSSRKTLVETRGFPPLKYSMPHRDRDHRNIGKYSKHSIK